MIISFWIGWCIAGWAFDHAHNQNIKRFNEINRKLDQLLADKEDE